MSDKQEALKIIQGLPDDCSPDDILAELFFKKQVDAGLEDIAEGRTITHEELGARIAQWRSSITRAGGPGISAGGPSRGDCAELPHRLFGAG